MKIVNNVKNQIKDKNLWKDYKDVFVNKQMRFFITKFVKKINLHPNVNKLANIECNIVKNVGPNMFVEFSEDFPALVERPDLKKCDAKSLAQYLYIIYQISRYFVDKKNNKKNIYLSGNPFDINTKKKFLFNKFIFSTEDNEIAKALLKLVK